VRKLGLWVNRVTVLQGGCWGNSWITSIIVVVSRPLLGKTPKYVRTGLGGNGEAKELQTSSGGKYLRIYQQSLARPRCAGETDGAIDGSCGKIIVQSIGLEMCT
jgi:hypothetical protein